MCRAGCSSTSAGRPGAVSYTHLDVYKRQVSLCPELDIASQGNTVQEARDNLQEALELFFETASPGEIQQRFHEEVYITQLEIAIG